jgi:hypothetical protein
MLLLVMGCATSSSDKMQSTLDSYETVVFDDGISLEESKIIAQRRLVRENVSDIYDMTKPRMLPDVTGFRNHQDYWFVFFEEKKPASIPFIFVILVNKENGTIKFSDDYNEGNQWILEAALLR